MEKKVTIVMTIRENYSVTLQTINSLIKYTTVPYRFIFINYKVPEFIIKDLIKYENIEIIVSDSPYPSVSISNVIPYIDTIYTIFLDNNIFFSALWLEKLIECIELNNAGIVGPVYLWNNDKIHMFGGDINITYNNFSEKHYLVNEEKNIIDTLKPRKCDYVEFHCLMIRTDLLKKDVLDPALLTIHQHIDLSLAVKNLGYDTYTTPYSMIAYENNLKLEEYEKEFFNIRWNNNTVEKDIDYFCNKWKLNNNNFFDNIRYFAKTHITKYIEVPKIRALIKRRVINFAKDRRSY
jgi:GT2 family glycosyltransferase